MPEIRINPITSQGVILAGDRSNRPMLISSSVPINSSTCPFCIGNEDQTPGTVDSWPSETEPDNKDGKWLVRSVPNRYAALLPAANPWIYNDFALNLEPEISPLLWKRENGIGWHEVIIESPDHMISCSTLGQAQWQRIIQFYARRIRTIYDTGKWSYVQLFKNQGVSAGASIPHVHSQLIAMPFLPTRVLQELRQIESFKNSCGKCVWCTVIQKELQMEVRIVATTDRFVVLCPFASQFAGEVWILPLEHCPCFESMPDEVLKDLGTLLARLLLKLEQVLPIPSYNIVLRNAPRLDTQPEKMTDFHWRLEITPRSCGIAGFEIGTGLHINPILPEVMAQKLRG